MHSVKTFKHRKRFWIKSCASVSFTHKCNNVTWVFSKSPFYIIIAICNIVTFFVYVFSGFFGDALDQKKKGDCKPCQCLEAGTLESSEGPPQCDGLTGFCACRPHVIGKNCDKCEVTIFTLFLNTFLKIKFR